MPRKITLKQKRKQNDYVIEHPETIVRLRDAICLALRTNTNEDKARQQFIGFMYALCWVLQCGAPEDFQDEIDISVG